MINVRIFNEDMPTFKNLDFRQARGSGCNIKVTHFSNMEAKQN